MKLQINTVDKSILLEEGVNLKDLVTTLSSLFPDFGWYEYKIDVRVINYYSPSQPNTPYSPGKWGTENPLQDLITYCSTDGNGSYKIITK